MTTNDYEAQSLIQNLLETDPFRQPLLRSIVQSLQLPVGSRGLDAGCGICLQSRLLADAIGSQGKVFGLDIATSMLRYALKQAAEAGYLNRITVVPGDVSQLPFADCTFDWVWSADCVGYPAADLQPVLRELVRVTRPGGSIILLAYSSQQLLPGYPLLESRLNANCPAYASFYQGMTPGSHFLRSLGVFEKAGLVGGTAQTYTGTLQAPLTSGVRHALALFFQMLWGGAKGGVSVEDWQAFQRLCQPDSPDFIGDQPDYYGFFTYSLFRGSVPV